MTVNLATLEAQKLEKQIQERGVTNEEKSILEGIRRQATEVQYDDIGTSPAERKLANALACLASVVLAVASSKRDGA